MKTEELLALGITEEQAKKVLTIHGKDIESLKARADKAESDRDSYKSQLTESQTKLGEAQDRLTETLDKFKDVDPDKLQEEVEKYKKEAADAKSEYEAKVTQRDQRAWLENQLDKVYGVTSPLAKKAIISEVMSSDEGLPWKNDKFLGFDDYMADAKKADNSLYLTEEEKKNKEKEKNKPGFVGNVEGDEGSEGDDNEGDEGSGGRYKPPTLF